MGVVVADERVLFKDRLSHQVSHRDDSAIRGRNSFIDKSIRLLRGTITVSMVARERLESTDLMPSCAKMRSGSVTTIAANITSNERNSEHVHHHAASY